MKLYIAGCRGSVPSPSGRGLDGSFFDSSEFGGNTTCFYIESNSKDRVIIDAGTGISRLGDYLMKRGFAPGDKGLVSGEADLLFTHTHWDHIQGFPFFKPSYVPGNRINLYGEARIKTDLADAVEKQGGLPGVMQVNGVGIKDVLATQQNPRNFPVQLDIMKGLIGFYDFIPGSTIKNNGLKIETMSVNHPGGCVSYRIAEDSKTIVLCSDFEPDGEKNDEALLSWWKGADIVVADGQYEKNSEKNPFMKGWGHSDPFWDVDLAKKAGVGHLIITHHDPRSDDSYLADLEVRTKKYAGDLRVDFAREGMQLDL